MMDIRTLAKRSDPLASFALIVAAITLIFAGTTTIIGNNVRDSIVTCNTQFGQSLIDSLSPRSTAQDKLDKVSTEFSAADHKTDLVALQLFEGKIRGQVALNRLRRSYARKAALYDQVQAARAELAKKRANNPLPKPPTADGCPTLKQKS